MNLVEIGSYTIGRGMANKQKKYRIYLDIDEKELVVGISISPNMITNLSLVMRTIDEKETIYPQYERHNLIKYHLRDNHNILAILHGFERCVIENYPSFKLQINNNKIKEIMLLRAI